MTLSLLLIGMNKNVPEKSSSSSTLFPLSSFPIFRLLLFARGLRTGEKTFLMAGALGLVVLVPDLPVLAVTVVVATGREDGTIRPAGVLGFEADTVLRTVGEA